MENTAVSKVSSGVLSLGFSQEQISTIKDTVAKGATDTELFMFLSLATKYNLDPFAKEIWFIKDKSGKPMIQVAKDGFLKTAQSDAKFQGIQDAAVYSNEEYSVDYDTCTVTHKPLLKDRGELVGAWCRVKKEGIEPYIAWAEFAEYKTGKTFGPWKDLPSVMIKKVATCIALRATFGITGVYAPEEIVDREDGSSPKETGGQKTTPPKKPLSPKVKTEAIVVEAEAVVEEEEEIEMITDAQVTMIHATWSDIASIKEWDAATSEKQYRDNIMKVTKKNSSKLLSKHIAAQYIEYLSKNLDAAGEQKDKENAAKKAATEPTATSGLMDLDQVENFINS